MLPSPSMRSVWLSFSWVLLASLPSFAQKEEIFGSGKPPIFREETMDRRFSRSKLAKMLASGSEEDGCVQLVGGLFVALSEVAPRLHKRDENFVLSPPLRDALQTQLSTPQFPALAYLASMVRRVMIDRRMPDEWLATAQALNKKVKLIDVAKLQMLNEQLLLTDSIDFTIPLLKQRYQIETQVANSAVTTDVVANFRDTYLDRDVTWGEMTLVDIGVNQPAGKNKKKKKFKEANAEELVAILEWSPPKPKVMPLNLLAGPPAPVEVVTIYARLQAKQYTDIEKLRRGQRVLIKGRFWEMTKGMTELEVREGLIFEDRDWSQVLLGRPEDVATCSAAINELTGVAPNQPGGFNH